MNCRKAISDLSIDKDQITENLSKLGISIVDEHGRYKSTYELLNEISVALKDDPWEQRREERIKQSTIAK